MPIFTGVCTHSRRWMAALSASMQSAMSVALAFIWCAGPAAMAQEGFIHGKVTDQSGAPIYGALVSLGDANGRRYTTITDEKGVFRIASLAVGKYSVRISASGFSDWAGLNIPASTVPESEPLLVVLQIVPNVTEVTVGLPPDELAAEQIRHEMKQRTLMVIPNFYVSYEDHPAPLSPKQKFHLSLRLLVDPTTVAAAGAAAGIQQAKNSYWEWGQGAEGYGKRFAAA